MSNLFLLNQGVFFQVTLLLQIIIYSCAYTGYKHRNDKELSSLYALPYYLMLLNSNAAVACYKFLQREKIVTWVPRQGKTQL